MEGTIQLISFRFPFRLFFFYIYFTWMEQDGKRGEDKQ